MQWELYFWILNLVFGFGIKLSLCGKTIASNVGLLERSTQISANYLWGPSTLRSEHRRLIILPPIGSLCQIRK